MMNPFKLSGFLDILKDTIKILSSNGRLITFTGFLYLVLSLLFYFLNTSSTTPFIYDFTLKLIALSSTPPFTPEYAKLLAGIRQDIGFFLGIQSAYLLSYFFISLFAKTSVIFISSSFYSGINLTLKELVSRVSRSWTRPFVTAFCVELFFLGYICFFVLPFLIPSLLLFDHRVLLIAILVLIALIFFIFQLYLSVVFMLGIVVSVVEDSYGFSALGKAWELVKGRRRDGFCLYFLTTAVSMVIVTIESRIQPASPIAGGLIQVGFVCLVDMFLTSAFTVLYYQCKTEHKKPGNVEYSAIPTAPLVAEDIP